MWIHKNRIHLLGLFVLLGFLVGILYANLIPMEYLTASGIFREAFLNDYFHVEIVGNDYFWYIVRMRIIPFLFVSILCCVRWKKVLAELLTVWMSFSMGILSVASILSLGMKGIVVCLAGIFPQFLFYLFSYAVMIWYLYRYPKGKWNYKKTLIVFMTMVIGIILEVYVNPFVMKGVLKLLAKFT